MIKAILHFFNPKRKGPVADSVDPDMKYLIAGLGNIGSEYAHTRHNIGFDILDELARAEGLTFDDQRYGAVAEYRHKGRIFLLLKPNTYVNLSGKAVAYWMQKEKIKPENLLVIVDDLALPFGTLRVKSKGSDAGHNGLKNIQAVLGHNQFARLRFGIDSNFTRGHQVDYVLGQWNADEKATLPERLDKAIEIIKSFGILGTHQTMNLYNNK
jgi:PTH1 family peptidyl-tRNA hydrolase